MPARKTRVRDVIDALRKIAPEENILSWDRVGLQLGDPDAPVKRVLTALELTDQVTAEAVRSKATLLVLHHGVIFQPLAMVREDTAAGKRIVELIRGSVSVYVMHTNFDACPYSMSAEMLRRLGVKDPQPAVAKPGMKQVKIAVFCPKEHTHTVRLAMADAGAGVIGEYDLCSFTTPGTGTFRGSDETSPFVGEAGRCETAEEDRLEMICPRSKLPAVVTAMVRAHPYEEPAYDIYPLEEFFGDEHFVWTGDLAKAVSLDDLARTAAKEIAKGNTAFVVSGRKKRVKRIAAASGGGKSLIPLVAGMGVDCYITGEVDHHAARQAEDLGLSIIAVGHYESEVMFGPIVRDLVRERFPGLEVKTSRRIRTPLRTVRYDTE
jgi:dinuclear metal center YbgI/SA1388 family protein